MKYARGTFTFWNKDNEYFMSILKLI